MKIERILFLYKNLIIFNTQNVVEHFKITLDHLLRQIITQVSHLRNQKSVNGELRQRMANELFLI